MAHARLPFDDRSVSVNLIEATARREASRIEYSWCQIGLPICRRVLDTLRFTKGCVEAQPPEKKAAKCLVSNDCHQPSTRPRQHNNSANNMTPNTSPQSFCQNPKHQGLDSINSFRDGLPRVAK